ncbi:MAG TPA: hypothetical protein VFC77_04355, partial [Myxococcota bacterium]|nr:hypothetical protein [Myxococcota bacterium]
GTHGRGFYVVDVTAHEQLGADVLGASVSLFAPSDAVLLRNRWSGGWGERHFRGPNPASGAPLWYWLGGDAADGPKPVIEVLDAKGKVVRTLEAEGGAGLHRVIWDLRFDPPKEAAAKEGSKEEAEKREGAPKKRRLYDPDALEREMERELGIEEEFGEPGEPGAPGEYGESAEHEEAEEAERSREAGEHAGLDVPTAQDATPPRRRRGRGGGAGELARPATYTVRLRVGEQTFEQELRVVADPELAGS